MPSVALYIAVFTISALLVSNKNKKFFIINILGIASLFIFAAGRYAVGTDFYTYISAFSSYSEHSVFELLFGLRSEQLFGIISGVCYRYGGRVLTWGVIALLILTPTYFALKKEYPKLSFFAAFCTFLFMYFATSFNVAREFIAVAIVFWGLKYVFDNKFWHFIICVMIASLFHISALISLFCWLFWDHKLSKPISGWKRIVLIVAAFIAVIMYQEIIRFISSNYDAFNRFESYAEESNRGANRDFILTLFQLFIILLASEKLLRLDNRNSFMIDMLIISALIGLTGFTHPQVKRIAYYFSVPATVVILGYLPSCLKKKQKIVGEILVLLYVICYFILVAYILKNGHLIPYRFDLVK